jgi:hypothetical protein
MKTDSGKHGEVRASASILVLAILAASLFTLVFVSDSHSATNTTTTKPQESLSQLDTSAMSGSYSAITTSTSSTPSSVSTPAVQSAVTTTDITYTEDISCPTSCMLEVDWASLTKPYQTLGQLGAASEFVFLGNVTASWTVASDGGLVNLYNITTVRTLMGHPYTPNPVFQLGEVGGTLGNKTMSVSGYPTLTVGETYVLFVFPSGGVCCTNGKEVVPNAPFGFIVDQAFPSALPEVTQGGPQGLFYVQGGNVYSLDNLYPQADAWLPIKVDGMPLAQFISELQSG